MDCSSSCGFRLGCALDLPTWPSPFTSNTTRGSTNTTAGTAFQKSRWVLAVSPCGREQSGTSCATVLHRRCDSIWYAKQATVEPRTKLSSLCSTLQVSWSLSESLWGEALRILPRSSHETWHRASSVKERQNTPHHFVSSICHQKCVEKCCNSPT